MIRPIRMTLLALTLCPAFVFAQQDFSKVEITATKVAGNVYMLAGAGGNIGASVGEDGIVIIDDQFAPLAPKIKAALAAITDKPVRFVLNTHWHGDHTGGNEVFGEIAPIISHENVRKRLASGDQRRAPAPEAALPVVTFDRSLSLHLNGETIRAIHVPHGHTDGDSVIFFTGSNVVHMGDDFFAGRFPFIDTDSGGSVDGLIAGVDKVLAEIPDDAKIIPGHGPLSKKEDLKSYLAMLKDARAIVSRGIAEGKTAEQLKKERVLAKYDSWGSNFISAEAFIDKLYSNLKK